MGNNLQTRKCLIVNRDVSLGHRIQKKLIRGSKRGDTSYISGRLVKTSRSR